MSSLGRKVSPRVTSFTAQAFSGQVNLTWAVADAKGTVNAVLTRSPVFQTPVLLTDTYTYADTGLTDGQAYDYTLTVTDARDLASASATVSATPNNVPANASVPVSDTVSLTLTDSGVVVDTTPVADILQTIRDAGFIVVTDYAGVTNDGTGDSILGLQTAAHDGYCSRRPLYFPHQADGSLGVYRISDTLRGHTWSPWGTAGGGNSHGIPNDQAHVWIGANSATVGRPVIKLTNTAPLFDSNPATNVLNARPVVCFREFEAVTSAGVDVEGTAAGGGANFITLDSLASATDSAYLNYACFITSGPGFGQGRKVSAYTGANKRVTVTPNWAIQPTSSSKYQLLPVPSNPLTEPTGWDGGSYELYDNVLRNLEIDTNGHLGATGVYYPSAQGPVMIDVKIVATGSWYGLWGCPGRSSPTINTEIVGGRIPLRIGTTPALSDGITGATFVGLTMTAEASTNQMIEHGDSAPAVFVGFDFDCGSLPAYLMESNSTTAGNTVTFHDGIVRKTSGVAFDNAQGKNMYLRNVYVTGTNNVLSHPGGTVTAAGTFGGATPWKRIVELAYCNQLPASQTLPLAIGTTNAKSFNMIDGVINSTALAVNTITASLATSAVPTDLVSKHVVTPPMIDDGLPYLDISQAPYNAPTIPMGSGDAGAYVPTTPERLIIDDQTGSQIYRGTGVTGTQGFHNTTADARAAIQQAIDDASASTVYNGRVFIPRGLWFIGLSTGNTYSLNLKANTKLFGIGKHVSNLAAHGSWVPTTEVFMINTVNDAAATTYAGHFSLIPNRRAGSNVGGIFTGDRFSGFKWRAGRASATQCIDFDYWNNALTATNEHSHYYITLNGGGKHYEITEGGAHGTLAHPDARVIKIIDTTGEPLFLYGNNLEATKDANVALRALTNMEITRASNIRSYGHKREGVTTATCIITDSTNIVLFGGAAMEDGLNYFKVAGTSTDIVIACMLVRTNDQASSTFYTLRDEVGTPAEVIWPQGICYYRRGANPDDTFP